MAGDCKDVASSAATSTAHMENLSGKIESSAKPVSPENANLLPGGTMNTAGGGFLEASLVDGLKSIRFSDLRDIHNRPCVRESILTGIGAGFGVGGIRAILGARVLVACNWAVGSFVFGSVLMHEYCQQRRTIEKQSMKRIVEVVERQRAEKKLKAQEAAQKEQARK